MTDDEVIHSFPWRSDNQCELLYDGTRFLPHMLEQIRAAQHSIDIELYIVESSGLLDRWLPVLAEKARTLPVRLLIDSVGSEELRKADLRRIRESNIALRIFNTPQWPSGLRNLIRDHRKVIVIDDQLAYVGGMGITDDCDPESSGDSAWLDAMVAMRGPVVEDWKILFEQSWQLAETTLGNSVRWRLRGKRKRLPVTARRAAMARVNATRGGQHNALLFHLSYRISRAKKRVWLNTPYFFPPRRLVASLRNAARRGVQVEICTAGPITDHPSFRFAGQHYYRLLLQHGVRIYEFQPRFAHLKAAIIDDWTTVGSCNYDRWNNHWNLDANVEIYDQAFRAQLETLREEILADSEEITLQSWQARDWPTRIKQTFWFWFGTRLFNFLRFLRIRRWNTQTRQHDQGGHHRDERRP